MTEGMGPGAGGPGPLRCGGGSKQWVGQAVAAIHDWSAGFGPFTRIRRWRSATSASRRRSAEFTKRLADNYPFFHPRYAGQMLKPPHPAAVAGYLTAMLINPQPRARRRSGHRDGWNAR